MKMHPSNKNCEVGVRGTHVGAIDGLREQRCTSTSGQSDQRKRDYKIFRCTSHCEQLQNSKREAAAQPGAACADLTGVSKAIRRACEADAGASPTLRVARDAAVTSRRANKSPGDKRAARPSGARRVFY